MISTREKNYQNKWLLGQLNESFKNFISDKHANVDIAETGSVGVQLVGLVDYFRRSAVDENSASLDQGF